MTTAHIVVSIVLGVALAAGVLVGLAVPLIGTAAAIGVILFFIGAVITHLRIRDYAIAPPVGFGVLAVTTLVLGLATY